MIGKWICRTFGKPSKPTSANSFSSRIISSSVPFSPSSANLGACLVEVAKCEFPLPPLPPLRISSSCFSSDRSARTLPVSAFFTTVPLGTLMYRSCP